MINLVESISTTRERFLNPGKISEDEFNLLVNSDPSKNKKYLDWMAKEVVKGGEIEVISNDIELYDYLVNKGATDIARDINYYKSLEQLEDALTKAKNYKSKSEISKTNKIEGAKKIFENEEYIVYSILNKEASCLYGENTKWCISGREDNKFSLYEDTLNAIYFAISKNKNSSDPSQKIAILRGFSNEIEIFDNLDKTRSESWFRRVTGLPIRIFKKKKELSVNDVVVGSFYYKSGFLMVDGSVTNEFIDRGSEFVYIPFTFGSVSKNFIWHSKLQTLYQSPFFVGEDFSINNGNLQKVNLYGFPKQVNGNIDITNNNLMLLSGINQKEVFGSFDCSNNNLKRLTGIPKVIHGNFVCQNNPGKFSKERIRKLCDVKGKIIN